jgi:hypothetical protein
VLHASTVPAIPVLWTPRQLDAIELRFPTEEARALVAEIRRLNVIAVRAGDLVRALDGHSLAQTPKLLLVALVERLEMQATGEGKGVETEVQRCGHHIVDYCDAGGGALRGFIWQLDTGRALEERTFADFSVRP